MEVDARLIEAAMASLRDRFPGEPGAACAAYVQTGELVVEAHPTDPETAVVARCRDAGSRLAALVGLIRAGPEWVTRVRTPDASTLVQVASQARRHAPIAVDGALPGAITVRPLWELLLELDALPNVNVARLEGRFGGGMKAIASELTALASEPDAARLGEAFCRRMRASLRDARLREVAAHRAHDGSRYLTPTQLPSPALRHLWLAFEEAAESFVFSFIESQRPRLEALGCNEADIVHVKQGYEALRNSIAVLFIHVGTGLPVANECPFFPYDAKLLEHGLPIDRYLATHCPAPQGAGPTSVGRLKAVLGGTGHGGFVPYLRQRRLFSVNLFEGGGTGHCPFAPFTAALVAGLARAIEEAGRDGEILGHRAAAGGLA